MRGTRLFYLPNSVKMCNIINKDVLGGDQTYFLLQCRHVDQYYPKVNLFLVLYKSIAIAILISFNSKWA